VKGTSKTETDPEMQRHVQAAVAQRAISRSVPRASPSLSLLYTVQAAESAGTNAQPRRKADR